MKMKSSPDVMKFGIKADSAAKKVSNSISHTWTNQAVVCYYNKCNCTTCSIANADYSFDCQMMSVIKVLLKELGPPDQKKIRKSFVRAH